MKIALCISGQPRNVKQGYEFIKRNIIEYNNPDIFIHTWITSAEMGKDFVNPTNNIKVADAIDTSISNTILELYSPTITDFEEQIKFDEKDYNDRAFMGVVPSWVLSMWYSVRSANRLQQQYVEQTGIAYDVIIRTRFDWAVNESMKMDKLITDSIICPRDCFSPDGFNDQFAAGPPNLMNVYSNLYDHIEEYYRHDGQPFCNEILLKHHLVKNKIKVSPIPIAYGLVREANKIIWGKR